MNKNPWQNTPGSRGNPPDLIELIKKMKGPGRSVLLIPVLLLIVWGIFTSFYTVQPEQQAVVKRLGAVVDITDPGLHFKIPFGIENVQRVASARVLKQEFGFRTVGQENDRTRYSQENFSDESLMLTGDLNVIDVEWVVQYRIRDPIKYLYQQREPDRTLRDISESVMRRIVGNRLGSEVLTVGRVEIAQAARDEIQSIMDSYNSGIQVITVELQDVVPPRAVQPMGSPLPACSPACYPPTCDSAASPPTARVSSACSRGFSASARRKSGSSGWPARSASRSITSWSPKRQVRSRPSAVSRTRLQDAQ